MTVLTPGIVLIIGGTSDIGNAIAHRFARDGWAIQLAGRDADGLLRNADIIAKRCGATVATYAVDVLDLAATRAFVSSLPNLPDVVVCCVGLLGSQALAEHDAVHAQVIIRSNFEGPVLLLDALAARMAGRRSGTIVGLSSVAGDRGRASNYFYGSAKAGMTAYLSGLRNRLHRHKVRVITMKLGFVATRMTAGMKLPGPLVAAPDEIGDAIVQAIARGRTIVYVRSVWRWNMAIIRAIPERLFRRMSL